MVRGVAGAPRQRREPENAPREARPRPESLATQADGRGILVRKDVNDPASPETWDSLLAANPWARETPLVAKPDQLIKRRGKAGLVYVNKSFDECRKWVDARMNSSVTIDGVRGPRGNPRCLRDAQSSEADRSDAAGRDVDIPRATEREERTKIDGYRQFERAH